MNSDLQGAETTTAAIHRLAEQHLINTYGPRKRAFTRGEGTRLWDADGKEYLDCFAGIAVCNLGHAHPAVTEAIGTQAKKLVHVSNLYYIENQVRLAERLSQVSFAPRWFFCNSGAEANEAAIKLARRYWAEQGTPKPAIIAAENSFHGRTLASVTATGQPKYHKGFDPLTPGFVHVPYNDSRAIASAITEDTGAVLLEPIQGEGGVTVPADDYLPRVRELCNKHGVLLILDEVQTGCGRTGTVFAHEHAEIAPDIMTLAKALGNGVPIGALGATEEVAKGFAPGTHASTFGGNPLCSAAALATLDTLTAPGFLEDAAEVAGAFMKELKTFGRGRGCVKQVRGKGFMIGVAFDRAVAPLVEKMAESGLICGPAGPNVLRFVPPLIISPEETDRAVSILDACVGDLGW